MPTRPLLVLGLLAALICGAAAQTAAASPYQYSVMMDDDQLVYRSDRTRDRAMAKMKALGVDYVRVTLLWSVVADRAQKGRKARKRFHRRGADNPKAYPKRNWNRYDNLVRSAQQMGLGVYFNVTGPGPRWGHKRAPRSERRAARSWMPKPREFKLFVEAVGRRYSGRYRDEDTGHAVIPRVSFWSLWNEPNQGGWLSPQWYHGKPYSPVLFRKLYFAGHEGLVATGHASDVILLGETAPIGVSRHTTTSGMYPTTFIRSLFCVDESGNPVEATGCDDFTANGPMSATAWAHHPYTKYLGPTEKDPNPNNITMANLDALGGLLDQIAAKTGRIAAGIPLALTEYGYETRPPDRYYGIPLARQAEYLNEGDLAAYLNPRVITQTQFLLRDVRPIRTHRKGSRQYWLTYQSGLYFNNGKAKPSARAYAFPLAALPAGTDAATGQKRYAVWGQLRWRPNGSNDYVILQYRPAGTRTWQNLGDPVATSGNRNYFVAYESVPGPGSLRAVWFGPKGPYSRSGRTIDVG